MFSGAQEQLLLISLVSSIHSSPPTRSHFLCTARPAPLPAAQQACLCDCQAQKLVRLCPQLHILATFGIRYMPSR